MALGMRDTHPEAEAVLIQCARRMTPGQKFRQVRGLIRFSRAAALSGLRSRHPHASEDELRLRLGSLVWGAEAMRRAYGWDPGGLAMNTDPIAAAAVVVAALDRLGIAYAIGGSIASSVHGLPRTTNDVDIIADVQVRHVDPLVSALSSEYYIDAGAVTDAIERHSPFNVIHLDTMFKVDVYIVEGDAFRKQEIARRALRDLDGLVAYVVPPEDIIVAKLRWFPMGGESSERQWRDVLEVLCVQGPDLDETYLEATAESLGVADLLAKAREEAARPADPL